MTQLATVPSPISAPPASLVLPQLERLICWQPHTRSDPVELTRALTGAELVRIDRRMTELHAALEPVGDPRAIERTLIAMMLAIPSSRATGDEPKAVAAAYVMVLGDLPLWSINDSAMRFARGEVPKHNAAFAPSAAELRQEAERVMAPLRTELTALQRVRDGKVAR